MKKDAGNNFNWTHYLLVAILFLFTAASLWAFMQENQERILTQNQEYAEDACEQTARRIEDRLEVRSKTLNVLVYTVSGMINEPFVDPDELKLLQDTSVFDYVEFIDADGLNHNAEGKTSDATDRENYILGMKGETGYHVIFNSRITGETLVNFYAPVTLNGEIIGVLNGMLRDETLRGALSTEFFGKTAKSFLCMDDGTVISFSGYEEKPVDNLLEGLREDAVVTEETLADVKDAFANHQPYRFTGLGSSGQSSVAAVPVADDWMLVQTFPSAVTVQMGTNANKAGVKLALRFLALFLIYVVYLLVAEVKRRRILLSEKTKLGNIVQSLAPLFTRLAIIDYRQQSYEYLKGVPPDFQPKGPLSQLKEYMDTHYIHENDGFPMDSVFDWEKVKALLAENGSYLQYEYRVKWDAEHWETISILALEQKGGVSLSAVFAVQDVTVLKKQEIAIQQALRDAFHAAEDLSLAKSDFLARMSHDMRTPMNAVLGLAQVALSHLDDSARVRDCLRKIDISGNRLLMLINDLLDMSKMESGGIVLEEEPFVLTDIVNEVCWEISFSASQKAQHFKLSMGDVEDDHVIGDGARLKQVLWNLLDNAVKYTPSGGVVSLRVQELPSRTPKSGYYEFVVEDTGIGIEPELASKIFEPFVCAASHSKTPIAAGPDGKAGDFYDGETGTGLGLPITRTIVKLMDGDIHFESEVGKGSVFTVRVFLKLQDDAPKTPAGTDGGAGQEMLPGSGKAAAFKAPLANDGSAASEDGEDSLEDKQDMLLRHAGIRVLLAEDNEINREIAVELLDMAGLEVETAGDGEAAVSMASEHPEGYYDVILMDLQMPVMDGYEAAKTIRSLGREDLARIPIIAVSANAFQENISKAEDMGMNGHVMKPIELDKILEALDECL